MEENKFDINQVTSGSLKPNKFGYQDIVQFEDGLGDKVTCKIKSSWRGKHQLVVIVPTTSHKMEEVLYIDDDELSFADVRESVLYWLNKTISDTTSSLQDIKVLTNLINKYSIKRSEIISHNKLITGKFFKTNNIKDGKEIN